MCQKKHSGWMIIEYKKSGQAYNGHELKRIEITVRPLNQLF